MAATAPSPTASQTWDLVVIGGGINGVAIARDAAMRGLSTLLLERDDLASGTTSWSTRLIHGGLRYLEYREFGLVRESLRERERLLHNAPHLVVPLPLLLPIYDGSRRGPATIRAGMVAYDALSFGKSLPRHQMLGRDRVLAEVGALDPAGLRGAARYYDAQCAFPERLTVELALAARQHGATIRTRSRVDRILVENRRLTGVAYTDLATGAVHEARARAAINVTGPWVDRVLDGAPAAAHPRQLIGGTRGTHVFVDPFPGAPDEGIYSEASDGRAIFILPWNGLVMIGTTDERYAGDLDTVVPTDAEVDYLLAETNRLLPAANLDPEAVRFAYAGVRPLPSTEGVSEAGITRRHEVTSHAPDAEGLWSVVGGKLTVHRALAEQAVDRVMAALGRSGASTTAAAPLPGGIPFDREALLASLAGIEGLGPASAAHLVDRYGARAGEVGEIARRAPALARPLAASTPSVGAEVVLAVEREWAGSLEDLMLRRLMLGWGPGMGIDLVDPVLSVAGRYLGWDAARSALERERYRAGIRRFRPGATSPS